MNCISFQWMAQRNDWIRILLVRSLSFLPRLDSWQLSSITSHPGLSSDWTGLTQALRPRGKSGVTPNLRLSPWTISLLIKYVRCLHHFSPYSSQKSKLWYPSKDNTSIPMFVLHAKSTKLDGTAPYLQYGKASVSLMKSVEGS
jgi:hypothetical protein